MTFANLKLLTDTQIRGMVASVAEERDISFEPLFNKLTWCFPKFRVYTYIDHRVVPTGVAESRYSFRVTFDPPAASIPHRFNLRRIANLLDCCLKIDRNGKAYTDCTFCDIPTVLLRPEIIHFMLFSILTTEADVKVSWLRGVRAVCK